MTSKNEDRSESAVIRGGRLYRTSQPGMGIKFATSVSGTSAATVAATALSNASPQNRRMLSVGIRCQVLVFAVTFLICQPLAAQDALPREVIASGQEVVVKLFGAGAGSLDSYGSGLLVSPEGHVLTVWNHLISTGYVTAVTANGRKYPVEIVGSSAAHDVALLKLRCPPSETFAFADLSQAVETEVGSSVLAFSNMYRVAAGNEPVSVVHGVIAARVPLDAEQGRWKFPVRTPVWLIDAITNNSGSAGGLLTDIAGRPVGLIGREIRQTGSRTWVNYAVPLTLLRPVVETLRSGRRVESQSSDSDAETPALTDIDVTTRFGMTLIPNVVDRTPAWIDRISPDSPAASAGLMRGDLIVLIDDRVITCITDVQQYLASAQPGQRVSVTVNRDEQLIASELTIPPQK